MSWFDVIKRGAKINLDYLKELLQREINEDGYVILGKNTIVDFFNKYIELLEEKQKQAMLTDEKRKIGNMIGQTKRALKYNPSRFNTLANNVATKIFKIKIGKDTPPEGDLAGVKREITRNGSVYFKNMDIRKRYIEEAKKIVYKRRYIDRTYK
tara:strand:- start:413 stop:874 length:462 start_codon:yes stop_codon:yes gene_type:complete